MTIHRICPICHLQIWGGFKPKLRERCMGHSEDQMHKAESAVVPSNSANEEWPDVD